MVLYFPSGVDAPAVTDLEVVKSDTIPEQEKVFGNTNDEQALWELVGEYHGFILG